jgi:hypothetical protein
MAICTWCVTYRRRALRVARTVANSWCLPRLLSRPRTPTSGYKARVYRKSVGSIPSTPSQRLRDSSRRFPADQDEPNPSTVPNSLPLRDRSPGRSTNHRRFLPPAAPLLRLRLNRGRLEQCSPFAGFLPGGPRAPAFGSPCLSRGEL